MSTAEEFRHTQRKGVRAGSSTVVVHLAESTDKIRWGGPHCGLVVSKKIGNAVQRKSVSRKLRHAIRPHLKNLPPHYNVVLRALPQSNNASYAQLSADLEFALEKCCNKLHKRQSTQCQS